MKAIKLSYQGHVSQFAITIYKFYIKKNKRKAVVRKIYICLVHSGKYQCVPVFLCILVFLCITVDKIGQGILKNHFLISLEKDIVGYP